MKFIKGYREDEHLRKSFNQLAEEIFGINFEKWYNAGFWTDRYETYSFVDGDKVIANVSVNKLTLVVNGEEKRGLQIGTVMTHPDYRNLGLSARLMNKVIEDYEGQYDMMYLFANKTVLDYYPKFGFHKVEEQIFSLKNKFNSQANSPMKKLTETELNLLYETASKRVPVSRKFCVVNAAELVMFYAMYVFADDLYYVENHEAIVICKQDGDQLHVFDIISSKNIEIESILKEICSSNINEIIFYFTPYIQDVEMNVFEGSEIMFVKKAEGLELPVLFKHPLTSQA
ncbi:MULTISPECIES: GNAT family N-acetyltransferase [unclassified Bacillus (in: firmicutes)]|uniref:GNAT family N-acetyltransferase n=1 Tax=unclassified Bacillus (in: firmicutes) TaxID=185979 RepID=UPI0008EEBDFC|nr:MULTISPECIES: GNAT family N-acetyltransferase [unclassified Bacillus (in: firmicutes)]SFA71006.1 Acetyltransferase (GNAT) domain-containing protein [Bacillus sp. UNCCL13]SFQ61042.1 Acetyltransferase (GNAT) domain-containing protein [Bacillus sp. cl95]